MCAIRVLLSLAAYYDWEAEQLDIVTAFLEAPVEEEIRMRLPEGFKKYDSSGQELVCKLHKALYGLKQAPRNWNLTITQWLAEYGFIQSKVDPGIIVYHKGKLTYVLALYVDDSILVGPNGPFIFEFKIAFGRRFNVQDLGPVAWLGMSVERDTSARTLKMGQRQYVVDMLERFGMIDCKPMSIPMVTGGAVNNTSELKATDATFQSLVGSLLHASSATRPDITMAVSHLSRFMSNATSMHWEHAERV